jgi:pyruvate/2-oxoglutarate dehydrogenase complex dihydrolipoamide acyltransferase (E2) component
MIHGLFDVDVTEPRRLIREHKAGTGERLSFTAFVLACLGKAADADLQVHAYRNWRNQLVIFDQVDVTITIEIELDERKFPLVHIVRAVNQRTVRDIHDEIRAVQAQSAASPQMGFLRIYPLLPGFLRKTVYRVVGRSPNLQKRYAGTVGLTSVGMFFGARRGWGLGMPAHTLAVTLGGIDERPCMVEEQLEVREYLSVTVSFDHDIVDGAPAARFARQFADLIERGYGLVEED